MLDDSLKQKLCLDCLFCCNKIGIPTRYEARKEIVEWLKIRGLKVKINSEGFLDIWHDSFPCPYLTTQGCSIYEQRPLACAVYDGRLTFGEKCKWTEVEDIKKRNSWYEFNKGDVKLNFLDNVNYSHILQKYGEDLTEISINELIPSEPSVVQSSYNFFMSKLSKGEHIEPIEVAIIDNEYIVVNGNNRAKAFKDFGLDRIQVKIIKVPSFRESFLRKTKSLYEHLKGLDELQIDERYEKRQERYSIKFSHHSKQEIETIIPEDNSILISIAGINDTFAQIEDSLYKDILRIRFDDIQRDFGKYCAFRKYQAQEILNFIDKNIPVNRVYINCEKGISRSGGIKIGLEKVYNGQDVYLSKFNTHVLKMLLETARMNSGI